MFSKEYSFKGTHADKVKKLTANVTQNVNKHLFSRNLDVYILAPIVGFLYQRKAPLDTTPNIDTTKIFPEQLIGAQEELKFNYRLIMLLDKENEPDASERIKHAFEYFEKEKGAKDELLYEEYVRGGIDVLYEKLIENSLDTVKNLFEFIEDFNDRYIASVNSDTILDLCKLAKGY